MFGKIKTFLYEIVRPMPLDNNFKDYDDYWKSRGFVDAAKRKARYLSKIIPAGSSCLDIGCGDGTLLEFLKQNLPSDKLVGVDISKLAVKEANKKGLEVYNFDVLSKSFEHFLKNKTYDYIIITELLEHIPDPEHLISLIRDNFNTSLFISIPNSGFFVHRLRLLFGRFPLVMIQEHIREHIRFWTLRDFKQWVGFFELRIIRIHVSAGLFFKPLKFLETLAPSLFANQILYEIRKK